jgi:hypothetical protein
MNYVGINHYRQYPPLTRSDEKGEVVKSVGAADLRQELEGFRLEVGSVINSPRLFGILYHEDLLFLVIRLAKK